MTQPSPALIDISFRTFLRAVVAIVLVWLWLRLWQWFLVFVIAVFLAVGLDPVVQALERRGVRRTYGAPLVMTVLIVALGGFFYAAGASLAEQAQVLGGRIGEFQQSVMQRMPADLQKTAESVAPSGDSLAAFGRALVGGLAGLGVALVLTVYLLLDGRRTYNWLVGFVPARFKRQTHESAEGARKAIAAYIRGNMITSALTAIFTWIVLAALQVPAALLLALLAGIFDLVPVIGFLLSAAPAILLGFTVSPTVGIAVALFYIGYNMLENYYIQPKVYGRELRLSDLAVIAAFLVGAELGGVLGAIIALPIAAIYPIVERVWMNRGEPGRIAAEHEHVQQQPEH